MNIYGLLLTNLSEQQFREDFVMSKKSVKQLANIYLREQSSPLNCKISGLKPVQNFLFFLSHLSWKNYWENVVRVLCEHPLYLQLQFIHHEDELIQRGLRRRREEEERVGVHFRTSLPPPPFGLLENYAQYSLRRCESNKGVKSKQLWETVDGCLRMATSYSCCCKRRVKKYSFVRKWKKSYFKITNFYSWGQ